MEDSEQPWFAVGTMVVCVHPFPNLPLHALEHLPGCSLRDAAECRRVHVGSLQMLNLRIKRRGREERQGNRAVAQLVKARSDIKQRSGSSWERRNNSSSTQQAAGERKEGEVLLKERLATRWSGRGSAEPQGCGCSQVWRIKAKVLQCSVLSCWDLLHPAQGLPGGQCRWSGGHCHRLPGRSLPGVSGQWENHFSFQADGTLCTVQYTPLMPVLPKVFTDFQRPVPAPI